MTQTITKDEAIALVRQHSWARQVEDCGHRGCEEHRVDGPRTIHTRRGGFGADNSLDGIEAEIATAESIQWVDSLLGHNLAIVQPDGKSCYVDVPRPASVPPAERTL